MSEVTKWKFGGIAMIVVGVGLILFGARKVTGGNHFEIMGITFGHEDSEPMSLFERWFWGLALIAGGVFVYKLGG